MTLGAMIALEDALTPNAVEAQYKRGWIADCEQMVINEIITTHVMDAATKAAVDAFERYDANTPDTTVLLVPEPYSALYRWYLEMQIALANLETERYNSMAQLYNGAIMSYQDYYNRTHMPVQKVAGALI